MTNALLEILFFNVGRDPFPSPQWQKRPGGSSFCCSCSCSGSSFVPPRLSSSAPSSPRPRTRTSSDHRFPQSELRHPPLREARSHCSSLILSASSIRGGRLLVGISGRLTGRISIALLDALLFPLEAGFLARTQTQCTTDCSKV